MASLKHLKSYETQWSIYDRNYWPNESPSEIGAIFSFYDITPEGEITTRDPWADTGKTKEGQTLFQMLKTMNSNGKEIQLSIGGWTFSKYFSNVALTPESRLKFVNSIIRFLNLNPQFNGVSLDWEYMSNKGSNFGLEGNISRVGDADRLVLLVKLLREKLNENGKSGYPISMFNSADPDKLEGHVDVLALSEYLDEFHVQGYDFADGGWGEKITNHQCNLYDKPGLSKFSCDRAIQYYLSKGVSSHKLFLGIAAYSRGFSNTTGLGQAASGGDKKEYSWDYGSRDYRHIIESGTGLNGHVINKINSEPIWDDDMKAHYWMDGDTFVSCDTPRSVKEKAIYACQHKLGGLFMWESSADIRDHSDPRSLMKAMIDNWTTNCPVERPDRDIPDYIPKIPIEPIEEPIVEPIVDEVIDTPEPIVQPENPNDIPVERPDRDIPDYIPDPVNPPVVPAPEIPEPVVEPQPVVPQPVVAAPVPQPVYLYSLIGFLFGVVAIQNDLLF